MSNDDFRDDVAMSVEVRRALGRLGDAATPASAFEDLMLPALDAGSDPVRGVQRQWAWALAAAVALIAVSVSVAAVMMNRDDVVSVASDGGEGPSAAADGTDPSDGPSAPVDGAGSGGADTGDPLLTNPVEIAWERVPDGPLSPRDEATIVWTGTEVLVVGGTDFVCPAAASCVTPEDPKFRDGAAYDPDTGTWRSIAEAPVGFTSAATAVLGDDVYFSTTADWTNEPVLLRYSLGADAWTTLDAPSGIDVAWALVATDTMLVAYSTTDEVGPVADFVFDLATQTWAELPDDPMGPAYDRHMVWDGSQIYLFDKALVEQPGGADGPSLTRSSRLDVASGTWERLADSDMLTTGPWLVEGTRLINATLGCADGGQVNNYGRCVPNGGVYDTATDTWSDLPNAPIQGQKDAVSSGAVGPLSVQIHSTGLPAFDAVTDQWFTMADSGPGTGRRVTSVGAAAFIYSGTRAGDGSTDIVDDAWIWRRR
ncbi:MAG: hypothetical protein RIE08_08775 [Acidimicrobiales bacterium]